MKTILLLVTAMTLTLSIAACNTEEAVTKPESPVENPDNSGNPDNPADGKTLILYYSYTNNVHTLVNDLRTQIEADVVRVEPAEEGLNYAANNYALGSALIAAIRNNPNDAASYPAIKATIEDLSGYETIIVAAPLWWSSMAAPLQTFLFYYGDQMAGKDIGLIVSSASSGISGVEVDARRLIPGGNFLQPSLWIRSLQTADYHSLISGWINEMNKKVFTHLY